MSGVCQPGLGAAEMGAAGQGRSSLAAQPSICMACLPLFLLCASAHSAYTAFQLLLNVCMLLYHLLL